MAEINKYVGLYYNGTKVYTTHTLHGSSSCQSISAARAQPQQQTCRLPLLLLIDRTDRQMDTQSFYDSYFKLCDCHYKEDWECCFAICCMYADLREVFRCCRK